MLEAEQCNYNTSNLANDTKRASYNTSTSIENMFQPSPSEYFPSDCEDSEEEVEIKITDKSLKKLTKTKKQPTTKNRNKKDDEEAIQIKVKSINLQQKNLDARSENKSKKETEEENQNKESDVTVEPKECKLARKKETDYNLACSSSIKVVEVRKNNFNKMIRDKRYSCYYCQKMVGQIAKHLEKKHSNEIEVSKILAMPKNSKKRRDEFSKILKVGNYYHNCEVLTLKEGSLILVRRPSP